MALYAIFNGKSNEDYGFIIEQLPDEHRPRRNVEPVEIPGKHGRAFEDLGNYETYNTSMKINPNGRSVSDVYAWLRGEGWLTTSQDPEYMRWVSFYDQQNDSRFRLNAECYDTITIPVVVQPYKYLADQQPMELNGAAVFTGMGNDNADPVITVYGTGEIDLMINGASVLISNLMGSITIDCDAKTAYTVDLSGNKSFAGRQVTVMDDLWPYMEPGENSVSWSGDAGLVIIQPWWRWL